MPARKSMLAAFLLSGIIAFHFVNNFLWLRLDTAPSGVDTVWHLIEAIKYQISYKGIWNGDSAFFEKFVQAYHLFKTWPTVYNCWPPLIYLLSALVSPDHFSLFSVRFYVNGVFLFLWIISTYFLGKKFFGRKAGIWAAFLVSFYPAVYAYSHQFELDFPLAGVTALCFVFLAYADNYSKRPYTLLLGLSMGIAALVRLHVVFYLAVPMIYVLILALKSREDGKLRALLNVCAALFFSFLLFSIFWLDKIKRVCIYFISNGLGFSPAFVGQRHPLQLLDLGSILVSGMEGLAFYSWQGLNLISLPLFIVLLFALWKLIQSKERGKGFLLVCFFSSYVMLSFLSVKYARYILPLLPLSAIMTAWAVVSIGRRVLRKAMVLLMTGYLVALFFWASWTGSYQDFNDVLNFSPLEEPFAVKPDADWSLRQLREKGVVAKIRNRLEQGDFTTLKFTGVTHGYIFQLYLLFQDHILSNKLNIRFVDSADLGDFDFAFFDRRNLLPGDDLLKRCKIVSAFDGGAYFLERR